MLIYFWLYLNEEISNTQRDVQQRAADSIDVNEEGRAWRMPYMVARILWWIFLYTRLRTGEEYDLPWQVHVKPLDPEQ